MAIMERMLTKHKTALEQYDRARGKRDKALDALIRAEAAHRAAVKAVARSQKRLDKARELERQAKAARKEAKAASLKELPEIVL